MGSKCKNLLKDFWFIPVTVLIISGILISGFRLCFTIGESMVPTLSNREPLLLSTHEKTPERYDIIVFKKDLGESLIKRVMIIMIPKQPLRPQKPKLQIFIQMILN